MLRVREGKKILVAIATLWCFRFPGTFRSTLGKVEIPFSCPEFFTIYRTKFFFLFFFFVLFCFFFLSPVFAFNLVRMWCLWFLFVVFWSSFSSSVLPSFLYGFQGFAKSFGFSSLCYGEILNQFFLVGV